MDDDEHEVAPDWDQLEQDLRWCLVEGRGVDGRDVLFDAVQMTDAVRQRAALHNGFVMSVRDEDRVANFARCERQDPPRLAEIARRIVGLGPRPG
jgi:hypothetical protein